MSRRIETRPCLFIPADLSLSVRVIEQQSCELEALQKLVGGPIELARLLPLEIGRLERLYEVKLGRGAQMFVHEEGRLIGLPANDRATAYYYRSFLYDLPLGIVGDAFVMAVP